MRKAFFISALFLIAALAQTEIGVTPDQVQDIVSAYAYSGEGFDMAPQTTVALGADAYYVGELKTMGNIVVMLPVDAKTGEIVYTDDMKDVIKTHYVANFFASGDNPVKNFMDTTLTYAQQKQSDLESKLSQFETIVEPQIPANVTLLHKGAFKSAVSSAIDAATTLRTQTKNVRDVVIISINKPADIASAQNSFGGFFNAYDAFLDSLTDVSSASEALITETNEKIQSGELDANKGSAVISAVTFSGLSQDVITRKDTLDTNKVAVNAFFANLDTKGAEYLVKLKQRVSHSTEEVERQEILSKIYNYSSELSNMTEKAADLPSSYLSSSGLTKDKNDVETLINASYELCGTTEIADCRRAQANFGEMETKLGSMQAKIDAYEPPQTCTGGKELKGGKCVCPTGTEEKSGKCVAVAGQPLNTNLIIALVAVIIVVIIFIKRRKGGGGEVNAEQMPSGDWSSRF
jgi:hypothetical protein